MPFWVYIIQSQSSGRYYCGYSDNVERRLNQHNDPEYRGTRTTKVFAGPWKVLWTYKCASTGEAVVLERKIKNEESAATWRLSRQSPASGGIRVRIGEPLLKGPIQKVGPFKYLQTIVLSCRKDPKYEWRQP
jgi:putative endonuclease